ncbi:MAG TPA: sugar nucleotide-binding protein, partial [Verrucomicrobiae bacterium]
GATGLVHTVSDGPVSRFEWTKEILTEAKNAGVLERDVPVEPVTTAYFNPTIRRPAYTVLSNAKAAGILGTALGDWHEGLRRTLRAMVKQP